MSTRKSTLTPQEIVEKLDQDIVGQRRAKEQVAIALYLRHLRQKIQEEGLRQEVTPKNLLMIGPTGVGKTEIARRLAKIANAPFIKVEATKFTEVGYVGRDVESMVRELVDVSVKATREQEMEKVRVSAEEASETKIIDALFPSLKTKEKELSDSAQATRQLFLKKLREGALDEKEIEIEMPVALGVEIMAPPGMEDMIDQLQGMFQNISNDRKKWRKMKVKEARRQLFEMEAAKSINEEDIKSKAIHNAAENGIIFIDELDKITQSHRMGADVSRGGVQRDLLPLVEGCSVSTKYGSIKTDHILFIGSGAFQLSKPSDLIPELQGRFPIRVELDSLNAEDFVRILTEPKASLIRQYTALLGVEGVSLEFTPEGVQEVAKTAYELNDSDENIGARRLHTVMEYLLNTVFFEASHNRGKKHVVNAEFVRERLNALRGGSQSGRGDLTRYIL